MHEAHDHARRLLEAMPLGLLSLDLTGRATMANPRACALLGLPWPLPAKRMRHGLGLLEGMPGLAELARTLLAAPESAGGGPALLHDPATGRRLLVSASLLPAGPGEPREIILGLADLGARDHAEAGPEQGQGPDALGSLAAGLAHDIRNPLTSIKTYASVMRAKKDQPGFLERFERSVPAGISRIEGLLDDLAGLASPVEILPAAVDLREVLNRCLEIMHEELALRGIAPELTAEAGLPLARGDEGRLRRAFLAILRSSCQAMNAGGRLALSLGPDRQGGQDRRVRPLVIVRIADSGPVVPAGLLARFFEPYAAPRGKGLGSGLDLALARKAILDHGGSIEANGRPGGGVTLSVRLPAWPGRSGA